MFRFYKITRFANRGQWIDIGAECDLATVNALLETDGPLMVGETGGPEDRTVFEFLIYEG